MIEWAKAGRDILDRRKNISFTERKLMKAQIEAADIVGSALREKRTAEEKLLTAIFGEKSIKENQSTPDEGQAALETRSYQLLEEQVDDVLNTLSKRERTVITSRFGLADGVCKSLTETGRLINRPESIVSQIEERALKKIRNPNPRDPKGLLT